MRPMLRPMLATRRGTGPGRAGPRRFRGVDCERDRVALADEVR